MADEIIQEVKFEGVDEAGTDFTKLGEAAEAALDKVTTAAEKASDSLTKLSDTADETGKKTAKSLEAAGQSSSLLGKLDTATSSLKTSFGNAGTAAATFATRSAVVASAATAAVGGIILLSAALLKTITRYDDTGKSSRQLRQEVQQQNQAFTDQKVRAVENAAAIVESKVQQKNATEDLGRAQSNESSDLQHQLAIGKISQQQFAEQKSELDRKQSRESSDLFFKQMRESKQLIEQQEREAKKAEELRVIQQEAAKRQLEEVAALQKAQEKKQAMDELVKKFGNDLTSSLLRLGDTAEQFWRKFVSGPSIVGRAVDALNDVFDRVGDKIIGFYGRIAKAIGTLFNIKDSEKGLEEFSKKLVAFGEEVTTIFEKFIIPAIKAFLVVVGVVAEAINGIFGTNLSAGGLLFIGIVLKLTGGFGFLRTALLLAATALRVLFGLFLTNPITLIITALALLALYLLRNVDWKKFASDAQDAARFIAKKWDEFKQFFVDLWVKVTKTFSDGWDWVKQGATDAWNWIKTQFTNMITFFEELPGKILAFLDSMWQSVKNGASDAWKWVQARAQEFADWLDSTWIVQFGKTIGRALAWLGKLFAAQQQMNKGDSSTDGEAPQFAGGGAVHGRGTSTSDSIFARLSTGEFVMKAAAVQRYGVAWMHSINQMRLPKFNMGGFVGGIANILSGPMMLPAFAGGGHVSQAGGTGRPIVLNIGGESFHLLTRDGETADQIGRFATKRRMVRTGRMPSHYGA